MLGGTCSMCPRLPVFPARCVEPEPVEWRDDAPDEGGEICPVLLTQHHRDALRAWAMLERGLLPRAGGWAEQDAVWLQTIEAVEPAIARAKADLAERMRAASGDPG